MFIWFKNNYCNFWVRRFQEFYMWKYYDCLLNIPGLLLSYICCCPTFVAVLRLTLSYVVSVLRLSLSYVCLCLTFVAVLRLPLSFVCRCPTFAFVLRLLLSYVCLFPTFALSQVSLVPIVCNVLRLSFHMLVLSYVCLSHVCAVLSSSVLPTHVLYLSWYQIDWMEKYLYVVQPLLCSSCHIQQG